jgi:hypothetical protein
LRDSHFENSVLKAAPKVGKVTGINLVDETSDLVADTFPRHLSLKLCKKIRAH